MKLTIIHWGALAGMAGFAYLLFRDLADVSQWWLQTERSVVMRTWYRRHVYAFLAGACAVVGIATFASGVTWLSATLLIVSTLMVLGGYVNPGLMMRSQQHDGWFVSIDDARYRVPPDAEVMVVEHAGCARAHPDFEMWRPHIAGHDDGLGGRNVVLTYCALTNLGMSFIPEIDGQPVDLKVASQLRNNLLMWDTRSGEPIQQLWGRRESDEPGAPKMAEYPSFKMPFAQFEQAYPEGKVFLNRRPSKRRNPLLHVYDTLWDAGFYLTIHRQRQNEALAFPTLLHHDDRLRAKERIWGVNVDDDYACFTLDHVRSQGVPLNVEVGGRDLVVYWDADFASLGIWYNDTGAAVSSMDFFGRSDRGPLQRVETMKAGAFFSVWADFFPDTDINRPAQALSATEAVA